MAEMTREWVRPGEQVYKVFNKNGALMFHGSNETTAFAIYNSLKASEERYARQARKTVRD
tara:strand:+ start:1498 stop:1677 length:180 start_codon:yes stop_codon:yes gene_type:complete